MSTKLSRRDLLRILALSPFLPLGWKFSQQPAPRQQTTSNKPNVLVFVLDAFSARHASVYGYQRETTPNLARFAEQALVYHNHHAGGNFTTSGTASLLTGSYPWSHRAFNMRGTVTADYTNRNLFAAFSPEYHRVAYTHNFFAMLLLNQFYENIELLKPLESLFLTNEILTDEIFSNDVNAALLSEDLVFPRDERLPTSLFISLADEVRRGARVKQIEQLYGAQFPMGFPSVSDNYHPFRLEDTIDWLVKEITEMPRPFLAYCHCLPPHEPYRPRQEFLELFQDAWQTGAKPQHFFSQFLPQESLNSRRLEYDQFLAYADAEFGRLYDSLQQMGLLDNTIIVVTSDHGQMFERGIHGHITQTLYEPVIRIPLLIHKPGQQTREDIYKISSATDILPTLLYATGQPLPDWGEGQILPFFDANAPIKRQKRVFSFEGKVNFKDRGLIAGTVALLTDRYKFIHYFGYRDYSPVSEFYDLESDPEEMTNLYLMQPNEAGDFLQQILGKLADVNKPYE